MSRFTDRLGNMHLNARVTAVDEAVRRALQHLAETQDPSGSWKGDYGGPLFLLPMYVGTTWAVDAPPDAATQAEVLRYFRHVQNDDGGFGLHVESDSYVFTTVLSYVALRLLGVPPEDPDAARALAWIHTNGGPLASASWGKFFLAILGLYDYRGLSPVTPELWLLPYGLPAHPARLWCHCRMVYLPMSWLYGTRAQVPDRPIVHALRSELYQQPWGQIDWKANVYTVAPADDVTPVSGAYKAIAKLLGGYERVASKRLRQRAQDFVLDQIRREDRNTDFICIGPVSKLYHVLVWSFANPGGPELSRHLERLEDYLWRGADGTKMQGYNNSELWDTAFMAQTILATGLADEHPEMIGKIHRYLEANQVLEDVADREVCFREPSKGGWPFSNRDHGWPITDCTAEGLKTSIALEGLVDDPIGEDRLTDAVDLLLYWQNPGGGWASYERTRGSRWLEALNPSNCFREIMVDYPYVECSSASLQAMATYKERYPGRRDAEIDSATAAGVRFILDIQRDDGSWYGSWGICFTYGTWFGVHGLRATGMAADHPAIQRACDFLESKQLADGGWGELAESSLVERYVSTDEGQAVMTGWALLTLIAGGRRESDAVARGIQFLIHRQQEDGSWPPEHIAGMFNKSCAIHYDNYLKIFPVWALGEARRGPR